MPRGRIVDKWTAERLAPMPIARTYAAVRSDTDPFTDADHRLKAIFVHVPRSGGRSIRAALHGTRDSWHVPIRRYFAHDPKAARRYFKFAVVRNPWGRFESAFATMKVNAGRDTAYGRTAAEQVGRFPDVEAFIDWIATERQQQTVKRWLHFRPQRPWVSVGVFRPWTAVDRLVRFERLHDEWPEIAARLGITADLPAIGAKRANRPRPQWADEAVRVVGDMYAEDVEKFGYTGPA